MDSNQKTIKAIGALLLFVFISGIVIFQFLQGPVLFSDNFISVAFKNSSQVISSVVLGTFSGVASILIAVLLLSILKKYNPSLAYLYLAFCIVNFISIMVDNVSVLSMLELSKLYVNYEGENSFKILKTLVYEKHWWTHYLYLLISCFPVFVLYYALYVYKLIPRIVTVFGLVAVILMFIEELFSIFGHSISMNMLVPIALIQFILPFWLIFKGFHLSKMPTN